MSDLLAAYPVVITWPVHWGDQDAFAHVNNTVYLRWVESSRIACWQRVGLIDLMAVERVGPILASIRCDYRRAITFPDEVEVGARVARVGRTSITLEHAIVSRSHQAVAAEATSVVVLYDYARSEPREIPDDLRVRLVALAEAT